MGLHPINFMNTIATLKYFTQIVSLEAKEMFLQKFVNLCVEAIFKAAQPWEN